MRCALKVGLGATHGRCKLTARSTAGLLVFHLQCLHEGAFRHLCPESMLVSVFGGSCSELRPLCPVNGKPHPQNFSKTFGNRADARPDDWPNSFPTQTECAIFFEKRKLVTKRWDKHGKKACQGERDPFGTAAHASAFTANVRRRLEKNSRMPIRVAVRTASDWRCSRMNDQIRGLGQACLCPARVRRAMRRARWL